MKFTMKLLRLMLYLACFGVFSNDAKFVGNVKDDDGGTITILDIQDDNKTQYLNQNFEQGNYNYGYDIKPSGPVGQFHHENKAPDNVVYGCYGYEAPDSKNHMTFYISDSWGYRPVRQEEDTEIFFPADNPGGGHQKGTKVRWADLVFPEMCAHFAERIASSTNLVTKAPIQVATPPASFTATGFQTSQPNTAQPLTGPSSPFSPNFGNKNTPLVPSSTFDIVHLNTPTSSGPSSPFGRLTSPNPAGTVKPGGTGPSTLSNTNLPADQQTTFGTPNRFSTPVGSSGTGRPNTGSLSPGTSTGNRPSGTSPTGFSTGSRTTPSAGTETEGSNTGGLFPSTGTGGPLGTRNTGSTRLPTTGSSSSNQPSQPGQSTSPFGSSGQTFSTQPAQGSSRPTTFGGFSNNPTGQSSTGPLSFPGTQEPLTNGPEPNPTTGQNPSSSGPFGSSSQFPSNQPSLTSTQFHRPITTTGAGRQPSTNGPNFGDRQSTGPTGGLTSAFGQTNGPTGQSTGPSGRPTGTTGTGRLPTNRSPSATTTTGFRTTTASPFVGNTGSRNPTPEAGVNGNTGVPTGTNQFEGEGSNSGLITPLPKSTSSNGNDRSTTGGFNRPSSTTLTETPSRGTSGVPTGSGSRRPSPPIGGYPDDEESSVGQGNGVRTPSPTVRGSARPTPPTTTFPDDDFTVGAGNGGDTPSPTGSRTPGATNTRHPGIPSGSGATPTGPNRPTTTGPSSTGGGTGPSSSFSSPPSPTGSNRVTDSRRPTGAPSSSRFPTAGFSGNFNNPSTLQPSSTNQQSVPSSQSPDNPSSGAGSRSTAPNTPITRQPSTFPDQRPSAGGLTTSLPQNSQTTFIPQEPDIDNGISNIPSQPANTFSSNTPSQVFPSDNTVPVTREPFSGRPVTTHPTFGLRTTMPPTGTPVFSSRVPTSTTNGFPQGSTSPSLRNQTSPDNDQFCETQCSSCKNTQKDPVSQPPPSAPRDEDFLNIPGALMSHVPVIFYPDCSASAYSRPAIVPFCPSSQPSSQCNNIPDTSSFLTIQNGAQVRAAFASGKKDGIARVARKVRRGQQANQRRLVLSS